MDSWTESNALSTPQTTLNPSGCNFTALRLILVKTNCQTLSMEVGGREKSLKACKV